MLVYASHTPTKDAPLNPELVRDFVKISNFTTRMMVGAGDILSSTFARGADDAARAISRGATRAPAPFSQVDDMLSDARGMLGRMEDGVPTNKLPTPSANDSLPTGKFNPLMRPPGAKTTPVSPRSAGASAASASPRTPAASSPRAPASPDAPTLRYQPIQPSSTAPTAAQRAVNTPPPPAAPPLGQKNLPRPGQPGFDKLTPEQQMLAQPNPTRPGTAPTAIPAQQMDQLPKPGQPGFDKLTPEQQLAAQPNPTPNSAAARQANLDEVAASDAQRAAERQRPRGNTDMYEDVNLRSVRDQVSRMNPEQQAAAIRQVMQESDGVLSQQARQVFLDAGMDTESINAAMRSQTARGVAVRASDDVAEGAAKSADDAASAAKGGTQKGMPAQAEGGASASAFRIADDLPPAKRAQEASRLAGEFSQSAPANAELRSAVRNMGGADLDIPSERLVQLQSENPQLFNQIQQAKVIRDQEIARAIGNGVDVSDPTTLAAINDLSARRAGLQRSALTHADQPAGLLGRKGVAQSQQALEDARIERYVSMSEQAAGTTSARGQGILNSLSQFAKENPLPALGAAGLAGGVTGAAVDGD